MRSLTVQPVCLSPISSTPASSSSYSCALSHLQSLPLSLRFCFTLSPHSSSLFRIGKRFHFLNRPCCSLKQPKKPQEQQTSFQNTSSTPQTLRRLMNWNPNSEDDDKRNSEVRDSDGEDEVLEGYTAVKGTILAGLFLAGVVGGFGFVGYVNRDQINAFLSQFSTLIEGIFLAIVCLVARTHLWCGFESCFNYQCQCEKF